MNVNSICLTPIRLDLPDPYSPFAFLNVNSICLTPIRISNSGLRPEADDLGVRLGGHSSGVRAGVAEPAFISREWTAKARRLRLWLDKVSLFDRKSPKIGPLNQATSAAAISDASDRSSRVRAATRRGGRAAASSRLAPGACW
jgi:hypothetical protein